MGRTKKPRTCGCPFDELKCCIFKPRGIPMHSLQRTVISLDEIEALRLCDGESLTQEEAGTRMGISRGTVQRLLESGRRKTISALVDATAIIIEKP